MTGTNVDYYAAGFDSDGKRIVSKIVDFDPTKDKNADKVAAAIADVKTTVDGVAVAEIISAEDFVSYLNGKVRGSDGKPIDYVAPEPTAEEKAAAEKASLAAEYASNKTDMLSALQAAQLAGNTDAVASIQADYKEMTEAYKTAVEGVDK